MYLEELKKEAEKILAINDVVGEFENKSFSCSSGGSPANKCGVTEVYRTDDFAYDTQANGAAYSGEVVVLCRETGAVDSKCNPIYITPDGIVFVFMYDRGGPSYFDSGKLVAPIMSAPMGERGEQ